MRESDEALAAQARVGSRLAFEELVRRHKGPLYGFCRRYVGDADDAHDVLQDAFAAAWTGLARYDPNRGFGAWLRTIALNKCRDFSRRRAVRRLFLSVFERETAQSVALLEQNDTAAEKDVRLLRLEREIAKLPRSPKEALLLTTLGGLTHQQASAALGVSVKAVEMRVYRAKRLLTARMIQTGRVPPTSKL